MFDLKVLQSTLEQIEKEKNIPREKILEAIEHSLAAAYKKDYGAKGQVIRSHFNPETGDLEFFQVKTVVDDTMVKPPLTEEQLNDPDFVEDEPSEDDERVRFNVEHHMYLDDAKRMRADAKLGDEIIFPLDNPLEDNEEFGRVAAMTAKQVIMQKLREAEKDIKLARYEKMVGTVLTGTIQKVVGGKVFVELAPRTIGVIEKKDQTRGEWYQPGERIKVYLDKVEPGMRGVRLTLSRTNPAIIRELFKTESPEVATGIVEIKSIAREAGSRTKIAVHSNDPDVDPIGACVGQRGSRINAVTSDLGEEKIDIIVWSEDELLYVANALAPAQVIDIEGDLSAKEAKVVVAEDQLSLAIGKEGQNARLAAKLTGWKIDISGTNEHPEVIDSEIPAETPSADDFVSLDELKGAIEKAQSEEDM
ncbi:transcription termination/antitermination protein NusA [Patescibacteria group bacterium]|nr:transcription termination/antitermination protein NusA [Patescibacteria group bacterium]